MDWLIKFLRLDKWLAKQVELGQKEREKLSGTKVESGGNKGLFKLPF